MSDVILIEAQPADPTTGAIVPVRMAGGGTRPYTQFGVYDWKSGVATRGRFTNAIGFDQGGFTGGVVPQTATIRFFPAISATLSTLARLEWFQAPIVIFAGDDEAVAPAYQIAFVGSVASVQTDGGALLLTISDLSTLLAKPACPDTFAGTGDLEGGSDAVGRVKRRSFGVVFNVAGQLLDKANNIYEFGDPNRSLNDIPAVRDKGRGGALNAIAWQGSALATLNALRAATPPSGGVTIAPSIACVKWWTTPAGPLTADLAGETGASYVNTAPDIANRLAAIYAPSITVTNPPTALAWTSAAAGVHIDSASETIAAVLDRLLLPVSTIWNVSTSGALVFTRAAWANPVATLNAVTIARDTQFQPLKTRRVGFQKNHRIQSDAEISAALLLSTDATYVDGTPLEVLKPAQAGADKTGANVAGGIIGQAATATNSDFAVVTGPTKPTNNADVTGANIAAGIAYQAWAATNGSQARTDNLVVPISGANRVRYSQWEAGASVGWGVIYTSPNVVFSNYRRAGYLGKTYLGVYFDATAANQAGSVGTTIPFPVTPGETLSAAVGLQGNGPVGNRQVKIYYLRADGTGSTVKNADSVITSGSAPFDSRIEVRGVVPSDAVTARIECYLFSSGSGRMDMAITDPMITSVSPNQPSAPPFVPGLNASDGATVGADVQANFYDGAGNLLTRQQVITMLGVAGGIAYQGGLATQNSVTGDQVVNGVVRNAGGTVTFDLNDPAGRLTVIKGSQRLVRGAGFGSNGDLVEWLGPNSVGVGSETQANCAFALTTAGNIVQNVVPTGTGTSAAQPTQTIKIGLGVSSIISRSIPPGGSASFSAQVRFQTLSGSSGTGTLSLQSAPGGSGSYTTVSSGNQPVGPDGPAVISLVGGYTNSSQNAVVIDVRTVVSGPSGAQTDPSASYLTA